MIFCEGVEIIDSYACVNMFNLKHVVFPSTLQKIGYRAFGSCKRLATDFIHIPDSTSIDPNAFQGCCKRMVKEVDCIIHCESDQGIDEDTISVDLFDEDELLDVIEDEIATYYRDNGYFDDLLQDAMSQYNADFDDDGTVDIYSIGAALYDAAKAYIRSCEVRVTVSSANKDDSPEPIEIDIKTILEDMIEDRSSCEQWDCDVGSEVESLMNRFMEGASWHTGFRTKAGILRSENAGSTISFDSTSGQWSDNGEIVLPILWFGYDEPAERWTIDENIDVFEFSFWFADNENDSLYRVVHDSDNGCFDIWYFAECGRWFPVISEIRENCPIMLEEFDTAEIIKEKINTYFCGILETERL